MTETEKETDMCIVCGCGTPSVAASPAGARSVQDGGVLHYGAGIARMSVPGISPTRAVQIEADILGENDRLARRNRAHFAAHGVTALNLMSSPGSGKTTLLCASIEALISRRPGLPLAVIEGDQQTSMDADRIRAAGADAIQVNTGRGCHLNAQMVADAFARLDLHATAHQHPSGRALLFIENVGNLVCPALWDLGEAAKVVVLSVTEGDDKPLKYPDMFAAAQLMLVNKVDLLPYVRFDVERCLAHARRVNPDIGILLVSATRGDGMAAWLDWLLADASVPVGAHA
jgi:hydrogenase nickel incorporation protein HypB